MSAPERSDDLALQRGQPGADQPHDLGVEPTPSDLRAQLGAHLLAEVVDGGFRVAQGHPGLHARVVAPLRAALARRWFDNLAGIPGTPGYTTGGPTKAYFIGLGELYVDDARFASNYGGAENAAFVRDAMRAYAERELS
jgi:hypothetical protein